MKMLKILILDSNYSMLNLYKNCLEINGCQVIISQTIKECLEKYRKSFKQIDAVIIDNSYNSVIYSLVELNTEIKIIIMCDYIINSFQKNVFGFLKKPLSTESLFIELSKL